ncbi:rapamycin-insensitive companion of mTOR [Entomortierella parvispora]|uniref:Rapamycin-insensitive companion of mTOR n=1 Tax=Entomortierella parvispora TaxID=205924 RepID=A0A9P3LRX2_9FUNG|nr:rapamycin-insensitive companion of mTOR [Entomortierella parvispora]
MLQSSAELPSEISPHILPVAERPASWTSSQGDETEEVEHLQMLDEGDDDEEEEEDDEEDDEDDDDDDDDDDEDEDHDMQDSDPDTTDNFDQDVEDHEEDDLETKMDELYHQLQVETKAKESAESLLEVYRSKDVGNTGNNKLRNQVEHELQATIERIVEINAQLDYYKQRAFDPPSFGFPSESVLKESSQSFPVSTGRSHSNSFSTSDFADNEDDRQSIHSALGDIMASLRSLLDAPSVRLEHLSRLVNILKQNPHAHPGYPLHELVQCLRFCLASTVREIRLNAFRCLRLLSATGPLGPVLSVYKIDLFIIRSLMADHRLESERIEALKLVRCFITTKEGMRQVSDGVLRAVIAIAEQSDERLRNACLETLGEMAMADPKPVARCGGFRAILVALSDNLQDLADALLKVFLYMLESPETRCYVRQGLDSEMVMAVFTDIYSLGPSYLDRVKASGRIVTSMVRSWAGLIDLCANDKRAVRSLVQSIKLPIQENRRVLLDMLYEIFRIQTPRWLKVFLDGKTVKPTQEDLDSYWSSNLQPLGLVDHHQSVVLTVFIDAGLLESLIWLIVENGEQPKMGDLDSKVLRKATLLVPELMQLAHKVLPASKSIHVQSLPLLFEVASNFQDQVLRHIATSAFRFIDTLSRTTTGTLPERPLDGWGQRNLDRIKLRIGTQMDEVNFRSLLNDTQVLNTKDASKWKWNSILEIIQGPMLSPRRVDEAVRGTKFTKRILAFYRPLNQRYSNQPSNEPNQMYTKIGCALFETLASTGEGSKYLSQNKILRLIADGLAQLDPMRGLPGSDPIFSRERMETTLTSGYFEMLGTLCKSRSGSRLLEKFKIFNLYYRLSELRSRDDIVKKIITSMDYSLDGHPRVILSKVMTSGYKHIRLFATQHLGTILKNEKTDSNDWAIQLLCTQLCDPSTDVSHMAVRTLDEACSCRENLDTLIRLRPSLDHLGEAGNPLMFRFLSTSMGFQHLSDMSYIEGEMDDWFMFGNRQYMINTEVKLAKAMELQRFNPFAEDGKFENEAELQLANAKLVLSAHFYGELTRTEEGCELLRKKEHFSEYARYIREHCAESKDSAIIAELKSVLWAVGNIGSTVGGLPFLEEEALIKYIVGMAERSKVLSLKGTCFYVLGLLCKTTQGMEILEDYGWQGILHLDKTPRGLCLPRDLNKFLEMPKWNYYRETVPPLVLPLATEGNAIEKDILKMTGELGNHILTNGASKSLAKIKQEHPAYFMSLNLYNAVLELLGYYHYRLPVRRFILGLFDVKFEGAMWDKLDSDVPPYSITLPTYESQETAREVEVVVEDESVRPLIPSPVSFADIGSSPSREQGRVEQNLDPSNRPGPLLSSDSSMSISQPPIPPPRPNPHAYEILYTNKPYHKNFAKEAGLSPLPPRVRAATPVLSDSDASSSSSSSDGSVHTAEDISVTASPAPGSSRAKRVVVGFNPPPAPKPVPNFAAFVSSRPRRQYNTAILAAHSSSTLSTPQTSNQSLTLPVIPQLGGTGVGNGTGNPPPTSSSTSVSDSRPALPDFSHLPQTHRRRPPLAPIFAMKTEGSTGGALQDPALNSIQMVHPASRPSGEFTIRSVAAEDDQDNDISLTTPLNLSPKPESGHMYDSSSGSARSMTAPRPVAPPSPHVARLVQFSEDAPMIIPPIRQSSTPGIPVKPAESDVLSPTMLPPPPPLVPVSRIKNRRWSGDSEAREQSEPSLGITRRGFRQASNPVTMPSSGIDLSTLMPPPMMARNLSAIPPPSRSSPRIVQEQQFTTNGANVSFPPPPPPLLNVTNSFQRMSPLANLQPPAGPSPDSALTSFAPSSPLGLSLHPEDPSPGEGLGENGTPQIRSLPGSEEATKKPAIGLGLM